ncbi:polysaccharide biosynthesis protein [Leptolyngbya sp. Heron Island J]|uniref:flippase n=1 Tax=Leptolyngbya sp. Heron Island J TaxID=1385935 RepID=UPI0003B97420|nr:flippase [Leptolyngbya sp. Heron Island J]ESA38252.1 polysaccharide biosynthesis protein [Leptolyngbya sp. Heron Island J]
MKYWFSKLKIDLKYIQPRAKQAALNTTWLLIERVAKIISELIVVFVLARYLGPDQFGILSYATAIISLVSIFTKLGLDDVAVRFLVEDEDQHERILATCCLMKLISGVLIYVLLIIFFYPSQQSEITLLICILGLVLPIQAIDVLGFSFKAHLNSRPLVISNSIALFIGSVIKILCVVNQQPLEIIAWCMVCESIISLSNLSIAYYLDNNRIIIFQAVSIRYIKYLWQASIPIMVSGIAVTAYMRVDQIMIKEMLGAESLGLYSAASKISESWYFLPTILTRSLLPIAVKLKQENNQVEYQNLFKLLFRSLGLVSIAIAILLFFFSKSLISMLFGSEYIAAENALIAHSIGGFFVCMGLVLSLWAIVEGKTNKMIVNTILGACLNIILNCFFIQKFGILGASISTVIARAFAGIFVNYFIKDFRPVFRIQIQAFGG